MFVDFVASHFCYSVFNNFMFGEPGGLSYSSAKWVHRSMFEFKDPELLGPGTVVDHQGFAQQWSGGHLEVGEAPQRLGSESTRKGVARRAEAGEARRGHVLGESRRERAESCIPESS